MRLRSPRSLSFLLAVAALLSSQAVPALSQDEPSAAVDPALYAGLEWRNVGPYRGGRSTAVAGIAERPSTYLMGITGGGVWETDDDGTTWSSASDGFFGGSIGAIDVADSDPNVIFVGTGSACIRGNTSTGRGVWGSTDGGDTWSFAGLPEAGQIGALEIHPRNPDLVYVAALGHPFGPNPERGVYRSADGGDTWELVLHVSERTGAADVALNPDNPREVWASMWPAERKPWTMISGSEEGGVWRSTDGGDTWTELTDPEAGSGLPAGVMGKIGLAVSPADPERIWALIEAADPDGGLWRSDDGGASWDKVNDERKLRQRAWYYTHVVAHPTDPNTVYALNTRLYESVDGGETFEIIEVPHGDVHDLWINPERPERMIVADDGGAQVTVNGGRTWSTFYNQPTAELYDVAVDNAFPYYLYAGQQDNTTIGVPAWTDSNTLYPKAAWKNPGGCETGPVALHPDHPEVTWGGCYGGAINRVDHRAGEYRDTLAYPQLQAGQAARDLRYRFQWVSPIVVSPHDPEVVYHASNHVLVTRDGGFHWEEISPDLTRDDPEHQDHAGGPIHHDITGVEIYGTVFALAVSPHDADVLWAGSDDGRVHVTRDHGESWADVTPPDLPELATVDEIDPSVHAPGRAILAAHRYRLDDFAPYVYRTDDHGDTWVRIADGDNGIPADHPVRTVREDPERPGLLYAGTEFGVFVSFDDGGSWQSLQRNLPVVPVTGMRVHRGDLVVSTQGRSFWILDDIAPLRQITDEVAAADAWLFEPRRAWRANMGGARAEHAPEPPPQGATIYYALGEAAAEGAGQTPVTLDVVTPDGRTVRSFTSDAEAAEEAGQPALPVEPGTNRFVWDLRYRPTTPVEDVPVWGYTGGPKAIPGTYDLVLTAGDVSQTRQLELELDPRLTDVTPAQLQEQLDLAVQVRDRLDEVFDAVRAVRSLREQVSAARDRAEAAGRADAVAGAADELQDELDALEGLLIQPRAEGVQDLFNYQPQLASEYAQVHQYVTGPDGYISGGPDRQPTAGVRQRWEDLQPRWDEVARRLSEVTEERVPALNARLRELGVGGVVPPRSPGE